MHYPQDLSSIQLFFLTRAGAQPRHLFAYILRWRNWETQAVLYRIFRSDHLCRHVLQPVRSAVAAPAGKLKGSVPFSYHSLRLSTDTNQVKNLCAYTLDTLGVFGGGHNLPFLAHTDRWSVHFYIVHKVLDRRHMDVVLPAAQ